MAETIARDGTSDTFGVVDVYTSVPTSEAAFTGGTSSTALNGMMRTVRTPKC